MSTSPYVPKYGSPDRIPFTGPGAPNTPDQISHDITETEKLRALDIAESRLEADVNDGYEIQNPERIHRNAAEIYATYVLVMGPKAPESIRAGDFADAGGEANSYRSDIKEMYEEFVAAINAAGGDESGGGDGDGSGDGGADAALGTIRADIL